MFEMPEACPTSSGDTDEVDPDEAGPFAFHCHLFYHMEMGMFRVVAVSGTKEEVQK